MRMKEAIEGFVPALWNRVRKTLRLTSESKLPVRRDKQLGRVVDYPIGQHVITLPHYHALPLYQSRWKLYDSPLSVIAQALRSKFSSFTSIDIGANVGDTAAAISCDASMPVLCIEGDPSYLPFLKYNAEKIGSQVAVEACYVANASGALPENQLVKSAGTTSAAAALSSLSKDSADEHSDGIKVQRLEPILELHPTYSDPKLVKIDTDGFDFAIISSHLDWFCQQRPLIFFEYTIESGASHAEALNCINSLANGGYSKFFVFDNFGNLMNSNAGPDDFADINMYLLSNLSFGRSIYYCDVLAISEADSDVADSIRDAIAQKVLSGMKDTVETAD